MPFAGGERLWAVSQALINGILLGGIYACIGVGFSLIYGVMNVLNFAHGSFCMIGAFITYWLFDLSGLDPFLSLPISMICLFVVGYVVQSQLIARVSGTSIFLTIILTFAIELIIINAALVAWSADVRAVTQSYASSHVEIAGNAVPIVRVAVFAIALALTVALGFFMNRTMTGQAIQATALDRYAAELVGINTARIHSITFAISVALAGAAGSLIAMTAPIDPQMGAELTIKGFIVAVLGGLGGVYGALLGGLVLGVTELVGAQVLGPSYQSTIGLAILLIVLVVRPRGLIGKQFFAEIRAAD